MQSGSIKAGDKNSVFTEIAKGTPGSTRDVEARLGIRRGRGNNYIEFNAKSSEFETVKNPNTGVTEKVFKGSVSLQGRNAKRHKNR